RRADRGVDLDRNVALLGVGALEDLGAVEVQREQPRREAFLHRVAAAGGREREEDEVAERGLLDAAELQRRAQLAGAARDLLQDRGQEREVDLQHGARTNRAEV